MKPRAQILRAFLATTAASIEGFHVALDRAREGEQVGLQTVIKKDIEQSAKYYVRAYQQLLMENPPL